MFLFEELEHFYYIHLYARSSHRPQSTSPRCTSHCISMQISQSTLQTERHYWINIFSRWCPLKRFLLKMEMKTISSLSHWHQFLPNCSCSINFMRSRSEVPCSVWLLLSKALVTPGPLTVSLQKHKQFLKVPNYFVSYRSYLNWGLFVYRFKKTLFSELI